MNSKLAIAKLKCKPNEFNAAATALGINPSGDISAGDCDRIEEYLTQPQPASQQDRGSGRVYGDMPEDAAAPVASQLSGNAQSKRLKAALAGVAEQVSLAEAHLQGSLQVRQAAQSFIASGGDLAECQRLLMEIDAHQRIPETYAALPSDPALALFALRLAFVELQEAALAGPDFFSVGANGELSLPQLTADQPFTAALTAVRQMAPALRPSLPAQTRKALGGSQ